MTAKANRSRHGLWKLPVLWKTANGRGFPQGPWTPANGAGAHSSHRPQLKRTSNESGQFTCQTRPDRSLVINNVLPSAAGGRAMRAGMLVAALATLACAWTVASSLAAPARTIAITVDDLPFVGYGLALTGIQEETAKLLSALKRNRVPAIGFVNEDKLEVEGQFEAQVALLQAWLDAGMELGNHGYGHIDFNSTPRE